MVVADLDYGAISEAFESERPLLQDFVDFAVAELEEAVAGAGIHATIGGRVKEVDSFAVKALVGHRYEDPLREVGDKAGLRIVVPYLRDMEPVERLVRELFVVIKKEQKRDALAYNENGYLGLHLDIRLHQEQALVYPAFAGLRLEVQVRTIAQGAWAEVTHNNLYKPPADLPDDLKRRIYRLVSLVELFDNEVEGFLGEAADTPGFNEAFVIAPLGGILLRRFGVTRRPDRQLCLLLGAALVPLYSEPPDQIVDRIEEWIDRRGDRLREVFTRPSANSSPLASQPEILLILERLENDRAHLVEAWPVEIPFEWLEQLAGAWGTRLMGAGETRNDE
jgi:ppGpp synthetase/RelA/SpoT-type nucleotidyltranferase